MVINKKDVALIDVDGTLIKWVEPVKYHMPYYDGGQTINISVPSVQPTATHILDFYGTPKYVEEIKVHTEFLKSLKARGYYIRVHSGNGAEWAAQVVKALGLEQYVDSVETKPSKIVDDKPMEDWCHPIYLGDK